MDPKNIRWLVHHHHIVNLLFLLIYCTQYNHLIRASLTKISQGCSQQTSQCRVIYLKSNSLNLTILYQNGKIKPNFRTMHSLCTLSARCQHWNCCRVTGLIQCLWWALPPATAHSYIPDQYWYKISFHSRIFRFPFLKRGPKSVWDTLNIIFTIKDQYCKIELFSVVMKSFML